MIKILNIKWTNNNKLWPKFKVMIEIDNETISFEARLDIINNLDWSGADKYDELIDNNAEAIRNELKKYLRTKVWRFYD